MAQSHLKLVQAHDVLPETAQAALLAPFAAPQQALIERALALALSFYADRALKSGEPALAHVIEMAQIVAALKLDAESVVATLLYLACEDSPERAHKVRADFGATIADVAEGVLRMEQIGALTRRTEAANKPQQQAAQLEALRKMLLAMVQDVRVVLIKLADHLQTLRYLVRSNDAAARRAAGELTRDVFAPLANRLGVWQLKWELEDLAFRLLEPDTYKRIARLLDEKRNDRNRYIEAVAAFLKGELARAGITAEVTGRPKHLFSIYKKLERKGIDFAALNDVRALRVLVRDVKDCYAALGIVHNLWSPIPKEFDDYIAKPKANNYQSLHTAVSGPEGKSLEVQIRTLEMHQQNELGVAAHWRYKENSRHDRGYDEKIAWLRQILDWKDEVSDASELAEQFKTELFGDTVYVLTPQSRVIDLPKDSTPIDFAYHVHTELGHRCRGAKVNGVMVPLDTKLDNGQQVEIVAAKHGGPSRDWLNPALGYLKSHAARAKVRQWFARQNLEIDVAHGRAILDKELQRHGMTALNLDKLAADMGFARLNDLLVEIARGSVGPKQLADALKPAPVETRGDEAPQPISRRRSTSGRGSVLIVGVDKLLTLTARCCKPAPPDAIVGFVTRGRGVSVHRANCASLHRLDPARRVSAEWGDAAGATYPVEIIVEAVDRTGLLRDISELLSREFMNVTATATQTSGHTARMRFTVEITNVNQLQRVLGFIRDVRGVMRASRR